MYVESGVDPERVRVLPNGVDVDRFRPDGDALPLDGAPGLRFLFVGGLVARKGPDLLLDAWRRAFAGREDVTLVVKDFGVGGVYRRAAGRDDLRAYAESGALPRVLLLDDELSEHEMAALYRACDVLVHPYRGEGFGMPVLEAMACGLPTIVTAGGPTDEFCPEGAGWRIPSVRRHFDEARVDDWETVGVPWQLEPDVDALVELLREAAGDEGGRRRCAAPQPPRRCATTRGMQSPPGTAGASKRSPVEPALRATAPWSRRIEGVAIGASPRSSPPRPSRSTSTRRSICACSPPLPGVPRTTVSPSCSTPGRPPRPSARAHASISWSAAPPTASRPSCWSAPPQPPSAPASTSTRQRTSRCSCRPSVRTTIERCTPPWAPTSNCPEPRPDTPARHGRRASTCWRRATASCGRSSAHATSPRRRLGHMRATLFGVPGSHPSLAAELMLERKGIEVRRIDLVAGVHRGVVRAAGFPRMTVPAVKLDGARFQGTLAIARALDALVPEPPLLPRDPEQRAAVERAESWADEVLQPVPRRVVWAALKRDHSDMQLYLEDARSGHSRVARRDDGRAGDPARGPPQPRHRRSGPA